MSANKGKEIFILVGKFLVTMAFMFWLGGAIKTDYQKAKAKSLNYCMPKSFQYMWALAKNPESVSKNPLTEYLIYYQKVARYLPEHPDAHEFLGFCYFQLGKYSRAVDEYQRAAELNPAFFWSNYNLGIAYFKEERYDEAATAFKTAAETKPDFTVKVLSLSKLYQSILAETDTKDYRQEGHLPEAYHRLRTLSMLSQYAAQEQSPAGQERIKKETKNFQVTLF
jgi:tetratricopeptide (TPR) repeat protein